MEAKNAKPKVNVEQTTQGESQSEAFEEAYFFHPVQLSEEKEEILDEKEIEKAKVEIEQKLQEFLKSISEETLQLSEFLIEEKHSSTSYAYLSNKSSKNSIFPLIYHHRAYP
ncbi:MAG: hypothetical protein ACUVQL_05790 [Candidatus Bathycorpusculaceae bacterium]